MPPNPSQNLMARFRDTALYQVYWWLTSVKLTVVLLAIILVTLIAGTIFEANRGTKAAQFLFYNSRWFDALLIFFALNLTCCTIRRFKRKLSQIGFITTHIGVMTILIGGLMSRNLKIEGQLVVPEGEQRSYILLDSNVLTVTATRGEERIAREYDTHYDKLGGRTDVHDVFHVPEAGIDVIVDRFYPDFRSEEVLADSSATRNLAVELLVRGFGGETAAAIFAAPEMSRQPRIAPATFSLVEAPDQAAVERELGPPGPATSRRLGVVEIELASGARIEIPVDGGFGRPHPVPGTPVEVNLRGFYPHFMVSGQEYTSRSPAMANPAVVVEIKGPGGAHEQHLLFSDQPETSTAHREGGDLSKSARYRREPAVTVIAAEVKLVRGPDGAVHYVARGAGGAGGAERRGTLAPEREVQYPEAGVHFTLERVLEHAQFQERIWNGGREAVNPALHVTVRDGKEERTLWVGTGMPHPVAIGGREVTVDYRSRRFDLGFSVQLEDFREINYPGISMAQSFESDVVVTAPDKQFPRMISMNNPLKFRGFKLFQSSFQRGERETSIFSVARDPGVPVVYTGSLILVVGLILIFFVKPYLIRSGGQRRGTAPQGGVGVADGAPLEPVAGPGLGGS